MRLFVYMLFFLLAAVAGVGAWLYVNSIPTTQVALPTDPNGNVRPTDMPSADKPPGNDARTARPGTPEIKTPPARLPLKPVDDALLDRTPDGALPKIAADGRLPWQYYARPFDKADKRPRVAVVLLDMGLDRATTARAIEELPGAITLVFSPFADGLAEAAAKARLKGHEILLALPMEPKDYPNNDPGRGAITAAKDPLPALNAVLGKLTGYVGVAAELGDNLTGSADRLRAVLTPLKSRGLLYLANHEMPLGLNEGTPPIAHVTLRLDAQPNLAAVSAAMRGAEEIAHANGAVIVATRPYPNVLTKLGAWVEQLEQQGLAAAPLTALAKNGLSN
ncbi:MAG: divergent polysaccharide deacetylase family protein [Alphaproteobacteria bacterium]